MPAGPAGPANHASAIGPGIRRVRTADGETRLTDVTGGGWLPVGERPSTDGLTDNGLSLEIDIGREIEMDEWPERSLDGSPTSAASTVHRRYRQQRRAVVVANGIPTSSTRVEFVIKAGWRAVAFRPPVFSRCCVCTRSLSRARTLRSR